MKSFGFLLLFSMVTLAAQQKAQPTPPARPQAAPQPSPVPAALDRAQRGDLPGAIAILNQAVTAGTADSDTYRLLAECYLRTDRPEQAVEALRSGLKARPASPQMQKALGQLLFRLRSSSPEAGTLLAAAVKTLPRDPEARHYLAQWSFINARERACVEHERVALKTPQLNDLALLQMNTLLGMCAGKVEDEATARVAFEAAEKLNRRQPVYDPIAAYQYIAFLKRYNEDDHVLQLSEGILERAPRFGPALLERAKFLDRSGKPQDAIDAATATLSGTNIDINTERAAHGIMARAYIVLGDEAAAAREQQWIEDHPNPETPLQ